ncbi:hypothetical protein IPC1112_29140 [Pseudomonas aeruginosa]|nr:hypothetical protein IPC1124_28470 [Pseudomonas aeruginosa]RPQ02451.1 hypothetical protein IPC1112_29140 [Pseudomonas aeruginosa]
MLALSASITKVDASEVLADRLLDVHKFVWCVDLAGARVAVFFSEEEAAWYVQLMDIRRRQERRSREMESSQDLHDD